MLLQNISQVASNIIIEGDGLQEVFWDNIDGDDVLIAVGEGALTGGASAGKIIVVIIGAELLKAVVDVNLNGDKNVLFTEDSDKTPIGALIEATVSVVTGEVIDKIDLSGKLVNASSDSAVKSAKSNVKAKSKNLDKVNNIRRTGNSSEAAKNSNDEFKEFNKVKQSQFITKALNSTVGKVNDDVVENAVEEAQNLIIKKRKNEITQKGL
ncbi:hypothetical protein [Zunongwangia sp.]|uniref:hypothetical protein n=1 Tax=Zunongwangia sp. TaxID=1965325 RepID=UPI003AA870F4